MVRRRLLRDLGVAAVVLASGCLDSTFRSRDRTTPTEERDRSGSCRQFKYHSPDGESEGSLPWDLQFRDIDLATSPVEIDIDAVSDETPRNLLSCTVDDPDQTELAFELPDASRYRIEASLLSAGERTFTASREFPPLDSSEALEITLEENAFGEEYLSINLLVTAHPL